MDYKEILEYNPESKVPQKVVTLLDRMEKLFGVCFDYHPAFKLYNRGGWPYAEVEAFSYSVCTSSCAEGPDIDWSDEIKQILLNLGFFCHGAGDNGMDSATNWQDTYWTYYFCYKPTLEYI